MIADGVLLNYIDGNWEKSEGASALDVLNPATNAVISKVPLSGNDEVDRAAKAGKRAYQEWCRTPVLDRIQYMFKLKNLLEENLDAFARIITDECGKTYKESVGELRRGIENVEVSCGMPTLMQGYNNEDIASGIDEHMFRQPLGVVAAITPFNFPGMIPLWFLPYAIMTGNCFILKPSEKVPNSMQFLFQLLDQTGLPDGVVQLVHGGKNAVDAVLDHPDIKAISFVGSSTVAKYIYRRAAENGKRVQCQGGAKNTVVILPDADMEMTTRIVADSAYGCAGQRCLANSLAITVGDAKGPFSESMAEAAATRKVGYGLDKEVQMGPVITPESKTRILGLIDVAEKEGAQVLVDGRAKHPEGLDDGYFLFPTLLEGLQEEDTITKTEVFGPVFGLMHVDSIDDAIERINARAYGNMACLFTSSGAAARKFRNEIDAGNVGINIGVAAPMAFFPFSGWKDSFFGDLHAQGRHGVEFYTQTKVVVERWPKTWSRTF